MLAPTLVNLHKSSQVGNEQKNRIVTHDNARAQMVILAHRIHKE